MLAARVLCTPSSSSCQHQYQRLPGRSGSGGLEQPRFRLQTNPTRELRAPPVDDTGSRWNDSADPAGASHGFANNAASPCGQTTTRAPAMTTTRTPCAWERRAVLCSELLASFRLVPWGHTASTRLMDVFVLLDTCATMNSLGHLVSRFQFVDVASRELHALALQPNFWQAMFSAMDVCCAGFVDPLSIGVVLLVAESREADHAPRPAGAQAPTLALRLASQLCAVSTSPRSLRQILEPMVSLFCRTPLEVAHMVSLWRAVLDSQQRNLHFLSSTSAPPSGLVQQQQAVAGGPGEEGYLRGFRDLSRTCGACGEFFRTLAKLAGRFQRRVREINCLGR